MIAYSVAVQVYNISRSIEPKYYFNRLFSSMQDISTRSGDLKRINFSLLLGQASFFYQGARMWDALPGNLKESRSVGSFKEL